MSHPFGDLLRQYRARQAGLSQTRLAELAGYDQAVLVRMSQGKKDLTGPSGRERVVRIIAVLRDEGAVTTLDEANALLKAAGMPPLYPNYSDEAALMRRLEGGGPPVTFGELLKYLRRRMQMTQKELGLALGYSEAQVNRLESGQRLPDPALVKTAYVEALGLQHEPALAARLIELAEQAEAKTDAHTAQAQNEPQPAGGPPAPAVPTNLPAQLTRFIGREQDIAAVRQLLASNRLVTLTGAGGVGKTRLALEVGASFAEVGPVHTPAFPDGVWLAELAPVAEPSLVADTVAAAFGLRPMGQPAIALLSDHLRGKETLQLLDNCEHLVQACAELAGTLLPTCPRLSILATSREALRIPGEVIWRVPSLAIDEATLLFAERARAAQSSFAVTPGNAGYVTRICQRLDGMPLALELAAARLRTFSVEQIAVRLDNAFRLLTNGSRIALPRQQTLRATVDWSYDLLPEPERALLRGLSVFAGGWTLEAVEALYGADASKLLDQLVNKSMVVPEETPTGMRYRMLEVIRQYAHEKLIADGEHDQAHQRHLEFFTDLAQAAKPHQLGPQAVAWLDRLEGELDNLRAALTWAAQTRDVQHGERLVDGVWSMWFERGYSLEGLKWVEVVLPMDSIGIGPAHVTASLASGWLAIRVGSFTTAYANFTRALSAAQQLENTYQIMLAAAGLGMVHPDDGQAVRWLEEATSIAHESGWRLEEFGGLAFLASRVLRNGDDQRAARLLAEALVGARGIGDFSTVAYVLEQQGLVALKQGDYAQARKVLEESVALARELRAVIQVADALLDLALACVYEGHSVRAMEALRESLVIYHKVGNSMRVGQCLAVAAAVAHELRDPRRAAVLLGTAERLWRGLGEEMGRMIESGQGQREIGVGEFHRRLPLIRAALSGDEFEDAWAEGWAMSMDQAAAYALQESEVDEPLDQRRSE
jgi:predicted ATPase/transcriptional regulator with XRE-family HTH domain/Tfp pilus assembly protein PilF